MRIERGIGINDDVFLFLHVEGFIGDDVAKGADLAFVVITIGAFTIKEKVFHAPSLSS
jgi:hypothetical protein